MKAIKFLLSSIAALLAAVTTCNAQLQLPFNVRSERVLSLYQLSPLQQDEYEAVLEEITTKWETIKAKRCSVADRQAAESELQTSFCKEVQLIFSPEQFNRWELNHGGNLVNRIYKEDLGMSDEQFTTYRNISNVYANRKKEIERQNFIKTENATRRKEAFKQYSASLHQAFPTELAEYLIYENTVLNAAKTLSKRYTLISETKAIKCAILKLKYDEDRKQIERQSTDRNWLRKKRKELADAYDHSLREILTDEEYVLCADARDKLTDSKLMRTYGMSAKQLNRYKELSKALAVKELVIKQSKKDKSIKAEQLLAAEADFEAELQKLFSPEQFERWMKDKQVVETRK